MNTQKKNPGMSAMKSSPRPQKRPVDLGMTEDEKKKTKIQTDRTSNYYAKGGCVMAGRGGKYKGMK